MSDLTLRPVNLAKNIPKWYDDATVDHYEELFGTHASEMLRIVPILDTDEVLYEAFQAPSQTEPIGALMVQQREYDARIRGFMIRPTYRGRGFAKLVLQELTKIQEQRLFELCLSSKPDVAPPVTVSYLTTIPYDLHNPFALAMIRQGFRPMPAIHFDHHLTPWEHKAVTLLTGAMGISGRRLFVFRKKVVDMGMHLPGYVMNEMDRLSPKLAVKVSEGLDIKLRAAYQGRGRVTYRFDLCPVCKHMGSTQEDDSACQKCYIHDTCRLPFQKPWRFKEDVDVSRLYWESVRQYLTGRKR